MFTRTIACMRFMCIYDMAANVLVRMREKLAALWPEVHGCVDVDKASCYDNIVNKDRREYVECLGVCYTIYTNLFCFCFVFVNTTRTHQYCFTFIFNTYTIYGH